MRKRYVTCVGVTVFAVLIGSLSVHASPPSGEKADGPVKLGEKSVTVFPVVVIPKQGVGLDLRKRFSELVGILLERAGMKDVRLGDAEFVPDEDAKLDQVATAFGKFAAGQRIETAYALLAEILGEREKGVDAIRTIVVDAKGNVVLAEEIQKDAFAKSGPIVPKDPMSCCIFIADRLRQSWNLANPLRENAPRGKLEENWRKRSGVPSDKEVEAIKQREAILRKHLAESTLSVCPAYAAGKPVPETAPQLTAMLADVGFASVRPLDKGPDLKVPPSPNEQEILWRTARQARAYFQEHPPESEYVLIPDFAIGRKGDKTVVEAVHWIICDQRGDWVMVDYQNSHHSDFQQIAPDSIEDCLKLVKLRLKKRLAEAN